MPRAKVVRELTPVWLARGASEPENAPTVPVSGHGVQATMVQFNKRMRFTTRGVQRAFVGLWKRHAPLLPFGL